ncbi:hypothetical protein RI367_001540 [Sorochytrium milnesiophthora]
MSTDTALPNLTKHINTMADFHSLAKEAMHNAQQVFKKHADVYRMDHSIKVGDLATRNYSPFSRA